MCEGAVNDNFLSWSPLMFVTMVIIAVWFFVAIGFLVSTVSPVGLENVPKPLMLFAAAILVVAVLFVMASCMRHLLGGGYRGSHKWLWLVLIFAGHIIGSTIYHFLILRNTDSKDDNLVST